MNRLEGTESRETSGEVTPVIQQRNNGGLILAVIVEEVGSGWVLDGFSK